MDIQDIARNTFTISALLMTATIVILNYSWKRLKVLINTMPIDKRRVIFNLRSVSDQNEHYKYEYIGAQFIACVFLTLSLCGALMAVFIMSGMMVGDTTGIYTKDNFELAVVAMRAGVFCLFIGMFCLGMVYVEDLIALYRGEPSITTTKLEELPKRPPLDKARTNILAFLMSAYLIVLGLIQIFVPYNQWVKMTVAIVAAIVLFISARFGYRAYLRIRNKRIPTKNS